ncbi:hypothetical protein AVEN_155456-1 [Araneus ventricosus]|uniref:Uncharacterized protein n=1 Tax=Araneus ventricosus TaxID=182803 RepID=A0A4Y2NE60_ARAVE|nr:hypothetical protein AVEN_155456-1 [Araneus ventricosus]
MIFYFGADFLIIIEEQISTSEPVPGNRRTTCYVPAGLRAKEVKLFIVPAVLDGTAESQINNMFEIVEEQRLSENISALCFDTTDLNIG